jgi:phospholipid/cholesterol/gamma-HCH transport system ATP-binding protein
MSKTMAGNFDDHIIRVRDLTVKLNDNLILNHLDLDVRRGEILGLSVRQARASRC